MYSEDMETTTDPQQAPVVCARCGRAYGRMAGQPPHTTAAAGLAATLTGWTQDGAGSWDCGLPHGAQA